MFTNTQLLVFCLVVIYLFFAHAPDAAACLRDPSRRTSPSQSAAAPPRRLQICLIRYLIFQKRRENVSPFIPFCVAMNLCAIRNKVDMQHYCLVEGYNNFTTICVSLCSYKVLYLFGGRLYTCAYEIMEADKHYMPLRSPFDRNHASCC